MTFQTRVWTRDASRILDLASGDAYRNLTLAEWAQYFPGEPYQPTFPGRPTPPDAD